MKVRRQKHVRRVLTFYKNNFGIQPPYHILIDGTFCKSALKFQVNLSEQMPKYLNAEVKFYTTSCVKEECKLLGSLLYGPLKVLQQFPEISCGHKLTVTPTECLFALAKNRLKSGIKLFVATQDAELSDLVRDMPGIPLLFISHNAINIESPSTTNQKISNDIELKKLIPNVDEAKRLQVMKEITIGSEEQKMMRKRKRKGGPNPLSCKKKKKTENATKTVIVPEGKQKKRRKKAKIIQSDPI